MSSSKPTNRSNNEDRPSSSAADEAFRRQYARALAEALLEQESTTTTKSKQERLHDAYVALCHDDPHVDSDDSCRALAAALSDRNYSFGKSESSCYRLSERLVEGILQATARVKSSDLTASQHVVHGDDDNNNNNEGSIDDKEEDDEKQENDSVVHSLMQQTDQTVATAAGYSMLAVAAFVKVPLQCCLEPDLTLVQRYLGSYRGPMRRIPKDDDAQVDSLKHSNSSSNDAAEMPSVTQQSLATLTTNDDNAAKAPASSLSPPSISQEQNNNHDHDSLEEVWAAESDPSDFEYESGYDPQTLLLQELDDWDAAVFDPIQLSKPSTPPLTWPQVREAVSNLIMELSYSKLSALSTSQWKSLRLSDLLTQLTLTLLIQPSLLGLSENKNEDVDMEHVRRLGLQPLHVFRDRAAARNDVWNDYLTLLQSLVAVHAAAVMDEHANPRPTTLAPATIVGLSSLSSLCSTDHNHNNNATATSSSSYFPHERLRQCVLEICEDVACVLQDDDGIHKDKDRLVLTLLPLLDRLTNVKPNGERMDASLQVPAGVSSNDAQLLLSSGLFRALVLSCCCSNVHTNKDRDISSQQQQQQASTTTTITSSSGVARTLLLQCVFVLSAQSPTLLGKYGWRVPEMSQRLRDEAFAREHSVDAMLWNLLGTALASSGSTLRLRSSFTPATTPEQCRQVVVGLFPQVCLQVKEGLEQIKAARVGAQAVEDKSGEPSWRQIIHDFSRFANYLLSIPTLASLWKDTATVDADARGLVDTSLASIRTALSDLPHPCAETHRRTSKSAANDKAGEPIAYRKTQYQEEEAAVRKAAKILSISLQQSSERGPAPLSSKTD